MNVSAEAIKERRLLLISAFKAEDGLLDVFEWMAKRELEARAPTQTVNAIAAYWLGQAYGTTWDTASTKEREMFHGYAAEFLVQFGAPGRRP